MPYPKAEHGGCSPDAEVDWSRDHDVSPSQAFRDAGLAICKNCGEWVDKDELDEHGLCDACGRRKAIT